MPVCLLSGAKDRYRMDIGAASEDESGGKGGTECGELGCRKECVGSSGGIGESKRTVRGGSLRRGNGSLGRLETRERGLRGMRTGC